ncbi:MAG: DUF2950 family protein [Terracidiphilus sp.]
MAAIEVCVIQGSCREVPGGIVSYNGIVYQNDLGPDTAQIAEVMERYNPDKTWQRTDDSW